MGSFCKLLWNQPIRGVLRRPSELAELKKHNLRSMTRGHCLKATGPPVGSSRVTSCPGLSSNKPKTWTSDKPSYVFGLAASPDQRSILYDQREYESSIMLVKNFQ
jgi:hypothetical protein